jgi:hypothetical protein
VVDAAGGAVLSRHGTITGGWVVDVAPDLSQVAIKTETTLILRSLEPDGPAERVVEPSPMGGSAFSPDARRFAYLDEDSRIRVVDVATGTSRAFRYRAHMRRVGVTGVAWLDDATLVINGNATDAAVDGDVWRLRLTPDGTLAGPPEVLVRGQPDVTVVVMDAAPGQVLFERVHVEPKRMRMGERQIVQAPSTMARLDTHAIDRAGERALAAAGADRWFWVGLDDWSVTPLAVSGLAAGAGLASPQVRDGRVAAIELAPDAASYVELDDQGAVATRVPLELDGGVPLLECAATGATAPGDACRLLWRKDGTLRIADVGAGGLGPVAEVDLAALGLDSLWGTDGSPDGRYLAFPSQQARIVVLDRATGTHRTITSKVCPVVQQVRFATAKRLVYSCLGMSGNSFGVVARDLAGDDADETIWESGDAWIETLEPIDDDTAFVATAAYMSTVQLLELR